MKQAFHTYMYFFLTLFIWAGSVAFAQTTNYNISTQGSHTIACSPAVNNFYDSGGSGSNYGNNENYTITFVAPAGNCVKMAFTTFTVENTYDFLYIYDGSSTSSALIGMYTGGTSPGTITSSGGSITIKFTSDGATTKAGWAATISCTSSCGSPASTLLMGSYTYSISSCPTTLNFYDDGGASYNYADGKSYTLTVVAPAGSCLSMSFTSFTVESSYDYMYIYDGSSTGSPLIGTSHTGGNSPGTVTSSGSSLTIKFTSDAATNYAGWAATISCQAACSGTPAGGTASASVTNGCSSYTTSLSLSGGTSGCGISYQWQSSSNGTTWSNISGATAATATTTVSSTTYYHCVTTCSNSGLSATSSGVQASLNCTLISSGGTVTTCNTTFYDNGGPSSNYGNNKNYTMTICPATAGQCIQAAFVSFATEGGYDFLTIYDANNTSSGYINNISGTLPNFTVTASTNNASGCLTFSFTSDGATTAAGWVANITCAACGTPYPAPNTDCSTAYPICSNSTFAGTSNGAGSVHDISNSNVGCLNYGDPSDAEHQSSWYYFKSVTTGTIGMSIAPSNSTTDYDWAIWGPMNPISCPPSSAPVRCSSAAPQASCSSNSGSITGMNFVATDVSDGDGCSGDQWTKALSVIAGDEYVMMIDNWNETGDTYSISWQLQSADLSCDITVLPIELTLFNARRKDEEVVVEWQTQGEVNNDYFYVERSPDGANFETIAQVKGAGNSTQTLNYAAYDKNPIYGTNYYRLKQTDYSGSYKYSPIVNVNFDGANRPMLSNIHPNPTNQSVNFDFYSPVSGTIRVELIDNMGHPVSERDIPVNAGKTVVNTDMENVFSGIYLLHVSFDKMNFSSVNKVIKQ